MIFSAQFSQKMRSRLFSTKSIFVDKTVFTARSSYASAVLGIVILAVCLSVCHTRALWRNERTYCQYFDIKWKGNQSSFLIPYQKTLVSDVPFQWNLRLKWPTPFEKRRLRPISAYDVSTVRASEKSSIIVNRKSATRFPTSYRRCAYVKFIAL